MYFLYLVVAISGIFVSIFFLTRSLITLLSLFTKSPFVPSEKVLFEKGLSMLQISQGDRFLDIGCGDGRVVFSCAKSYPEASSYEGIDRIGLLVIFARFKKVFSCKKLKISFKRADAKNYSYGKYNKVFMYLLPEFVAELMPILEKELPSKSIVVSIAFRIPEEYGKTGELSVDEVKVGRKTKKIYVWEKK